MISYVFQDWDTNKDSLKIRLALTLFRLCQHLDSHDAPAILRKSCRAVYVVAVEWVLGIELPVRVRVGPRLRIAHGVGLVVHRSAQLGSDCLLRHGVTIGTSESGTTGVYAPIIGDHVQFGSGSQVIGAVRVGDNAKIGAGAVVVSDVAAGAVVGGIPARPVGRKTLDS
jgi:serine acetyltransferase